jgi:hypothetical protein
MTLADADVIGLASERQTRSLRRISDMVSSQMILAEAGVSLGVAVASALFA